MNWVKVNETKDLKHLVKSGVVPTDRLVEIWTDINDEYRNLLSDTEAQILFDLRKQIVTEDRNLITITSIVKQLKIRRNEDLIGILQNDFNFTFKYVDLASDLEKTLKRVKARIVALKLEEKEYSDQNKTDDENPVGVSQFDVLEQLAVLSEANGIHLRIQDLTVAEYIAYYNRFKFSIEMKLKNAER